MSVRGGHQSRALSVVFVPTSRCNAACAYCFSAARGESMELAAVEVIAGRLATYVSDQGLKRINFFSQGGEVMLLGHDWVRRAHRILQDRLAEAGAEVVHRLQTNLLLLDDPWLEVIHEVFNARVSTSFDYPNVHRVQPGRDAAAYTELWLEKLALAQAAGCRAGIICIPGAATVKAGAREVCSFFYEKAGAHGFQVNLPFPSRAWEQRQTGRIKLASVEELTPFMCDLYDEWDRHWAAVGRQLQPLSRLKEYFAGGNRRLPCVWGRDCSRDFICIGPGGEVGLCDCWVLSYPEFNFGNLLETPLAVLLESPHRARLSERLATLAGGQCGECRDLENCFGGCPIRAFTGTGDIAAADPYCSLYQRLFRHIESSLAGDSPGEVTS